MVYIVVVNPIGFREYSQEKVFDSYEEAKEYFNQFAWCHGSECEYRLLRADNEFTAKRSLIAKI